MDSVKVVSDVPLDGNWMRLMEESLSSVMEEFSVETIVTDIADNKAHAVLMMSLLRTIGGSMFFRGCHAGIQQMKMAHEYLKCNEK